MHDFIFAGSPPVGALFALAPLFILLAVWSIAIKGYGLWVSARSMQKWWFIALLLLNTGGILELVYLIWFAPPGSNRIAGLFPRPTKPSADTPSAPQAQI
jgi:hypothetical protein